VEREDAYFDSGKERCAAWLFRPSAASAPAPCVVMASGFSCVRDQGLDGFAERFAAAGFAVLAFDYRGFADSGGEPRQLVLAGRQRDDWRAALAYARSLDSVDKRRIAIWGFSAGGGHVQSLALTEAGIGAAICVAPLVDGARTLHYIGGLSHVIRLGLAGTRDGLRALRRAKPYCIPAAGPPGSGAVINSPEGLSGFEAITPPDSDWRNEACARTFLAPPYRLARKTRRISIPILYCITEDDDVAPPALGIKAAERAPHGELRIYAGGHFDPFLGETLERMAADQLEFLGRRLTASATI
jgi:dienelactone hydrolase